MPNSSFEKGRGADKPHMFVAGLVRNAATTLSKELYRIDSELSAIFDLDWIVIESDSEDGTIEVLEKFRASNSRFEFKALGALRDTIPDRIDRICHCRNVYLEHIQKHDKFSDSSWVLVMDLDNLNKKFSGRAILSATTSNQADVYFANQAGPYYDIFVLRHEAWNPRDFSRDYDSLIRSGATDKQALNISVYSKMIRIPTNEKVFYVDSAFGGLGVYKASALANKKYSTSEGDSNSVCEHVGLHRQLRAEGFKLAIKPDLINAKYTEHTLVFHPVLKWFFKTSKLFRSPMIALFGEERSQKAFSWFVSRLKTK